MEEEIWKPVVGWEGFYEISSLGRLRSLGRTIKCRGGTRFVKGRILRLSQSSPNGYAVPALTGGGRRASAYVHRMVAAAFLPKSTKPQVNHIDGNKMNNAASNLEWCTNKENSTHSVDVLGRLSGDKNGSAKLSSQQVMSIVAFSALGFRVQEIGKSFGVSASNIYAILSGENWRRVTGLSLRHRAFSSGDPSRPEVVA